MMIDPQAVGTWIGVGGAAVAGGLALWKRQSKTALDVATDRGEKSMHQRSLDLAKEADERAAAAIRRERETWAIHERDAQAIADLKAENIVCQQAVSLLTKQVASLRRIIHRIATEEQRRALASDFGELDDPIDEPRPPSRKLP